jgi:hypothetical protein
VGPIGRAEKEVDQRAGVTFIIFYGGRALRKKGPSDSIVEAGALGKVGEIIICCHLAVLF